MSGLCSDFLATIERVERYARYARYALLGASERGHEEVLSVILKLAADVSLRVSLQCC